MRLILQRRQQRREPLCLVACSDDDRNRGKGAPTLRRAGGCGAKAGPQRDPAGTVDESRYGEEVDDRKEGSGVGSALGALSSNAGVPTNATRAQNRCEQTAARKRRVQTAGRKPPPANAARKRRPQTPLANRRAPNWPVQTNEDMVRIPLPIA
jgi:hypothetical protein